MNSNIDIIYTKCSKCKDYYTSTIKTSGLPLKTCEKCRSKAKEAKTKMCEHDKRKTQCEECFKNRIIILRMESNHNNNNS